MEFTDEVVLEQETLNNTRLTTDGYWVVDARVGRTGIQVYRGSEMGRDDLPLIRVHRPEDEVFSADAMKSAAFRPVTNDHPKQMVNSKTWKKVSVGLTGDTVARDGEHLRVPFTLMDADAIDDVRKGKRQLSLGYYAKIDWTAGETPQGEKYDAVQRGIRINHLAVVDSARAGPTCRIGDSWTTPADPSQPERNDPDMPENLRVVLVDGISISVTDQGAQAIEKLQRQLADATATSTTALAARDAEIATLRDGHTRALAAKDGEIAGLVANHTKGVEAKDGEITGLKASHKTALDAKDGEITALKAKMPDATALDALIATRATVIDAAKKILGDAFDPKGKTEADIRRAAVAKRLGDASVTDRSDDYVGACFDTLTATAPEQQGRDPIRDHLRRGVQQPGQRQQQTDADPDAAYNAYVKSLRDGWLPAQESK